MQVELTPENKKAIEDYRTEVQKGIPLFNPSITELANEGIREYFQDAMTIQRRINKTPKK